MDRSLALFFLPACVSFVAVKPQPATLSVASLPAVITQSTFPNGLAPVTGTLAGGALEERNHVTLTDAGTLIASADVGNGDFALLWPVPLGENAVAHTLKVQAVDALGRMVGSQVLQVTVSDSGPSVDGFSLAPSLVAAGVLEASWQISAGYDHVVLQLDAGAPATFDSATTGEIFSGLGVGQVHTATLIAYDAAQNAAPAIVRSAAAGVLFAASNNGVGELADGSRELAYPSIAAAIEALTSAKIDFTVHALAGTYDLASGEAFPLTLAPGINLQGNRDALGNWLTHLSGSGAIASPDVSGTDCVSVYALGSASAGEPSARALSVSDLDIDTTAAPIACASALQIAVLSEWVNSDIHGIHTSAGQVGIEVTGRNFATSPHLHDNDLEGLAGVGSAGIRAAGFAVPLVEHNVVKGTDAATNFCYLYGGGEAVSDFSDSAAVIVHRANQATRCRYGVYAFDDQLVKMVADSTARNQIEITGPFNAGEGTEIHAVHIGVTGANDPTGLAMCGTDIVIDADVPDSFQDADTSTSEGVHGEGTVIMSLGAVPSVTFGVSLTDADCDNDPRVSVTAHSKVAGLHYVRSSALGGLSIAGAVFFSDDLSLPLPVPTGTFSPLDGSIGIWLDANFASVPFLIANSRVSGFFSNLVSTGTTSGARTLNSISTCYAPFGDPAALGPCQKTDIDGVPAYASLPSGADTTSTNNACEVTNGKTCAASELCQPNLNFAIYRSQDTLTFSANGGGCP